MPGRHPSAKQLLAGVLVCFYAAGLPSLFVGWLAAEASAYQICWTLLGHPWTATRGLGFRALCCYPCLRLNGRQAPTKTSWTYANRLP